MKYARVDFFQVTGWMFIGLVAAAIAFFVYLPNYTRLKKLRSENTVLRGDINRLNREIDTLRSNIRRLDNDPSFWEQLARQHAGAAREGEIVVDIKQEGE